MILGDFLGENVFRSRGAFACGRIVMSPYIVGWVDSLIRGIGDTSIHIAKAPLWHCKFKSYKAKRLVSVCDGTI